MTEDVPRSQHKVSVRELVAFALRGGDLHHHQFGSITALEGIRGHQRLQEARGSEYESEVRVRRLYLCHDMELVISGRIDGVFPRRNPVVVEEIKTTRRPFDEVTPATDQLHMAQGMMYAVLYALEHQLKGVVVQLTYFNIDSGRTSSRCQYADAAELDRFFEGVVQRYLRWARMLHQWRQQRDQSLAQLAFPFAEYREGQRQFAIAAYRIIRDGGKLFAQAPTGIGKTMAALYPALKALGEGHVRRLFFLTAKSNGAQMAEKAALLLRQQGLRAKLVCVTAKDKICFNAPCRQETCEYALGYYDRLRTALEESFEEQHFNRETIERHAQKHQLCPFEFSLDLAMYADVVVCDYNYAFDPGAYLRRFFNLETEGNVLLVDEAHNLVDRSRDMYSAEITRNQLLEVAREIKQELPKQATAVNSMSRAFAKQTKLIQAKGETELVETAAPETVMPSMMRFCQSFEHWLSEEQPEEVPTSLRELYFQVRRFLRSAEIFDEHFASIYRMEGRQLNVKIQCLDAAHLLQKFLNLCSATLYFSATLSPFHFYRKLLGGDQSSPVLSLASPFPPERLGLLVCGNISTRYTDRESSLAALVATIEVVVAARTGNYLVFFPSYRYLRQAVELLKKGVPTFQCLVQEPGMDEQQRHKFLAAFEAGEAGTLVGFAVMGGAFGEGIDLVGEALIGVIVVGVGLPMICTERDLMRQHFDRAGEPGFEFAYQFPGMNRVLQTAGRVIRDAEDKGIVCLIDNRFCQQRYRNMFPPWWRPHLTRGPDDMRAFFHQFWSS